MELWVIIHNQHFQTVFLAPREDLLLEDFKHHWTIDGFLFEVSFYHNVTVFVAKVHAIIEAEWFKTPD